MSFRLLILTGRLASSSGRKHHQTNPKNARYNRTIPNNNYQASAAAEGKGC
jgi:hypothetical protein